MGEKKSPGTGGGLSFADFDASDSPNPRQNPFPRSDNREEARYSPPDDFEALRNSLELDFEPDEAEGRTRFHGVPVERTRHSPAAPAEPVDVLDAEDDIPLDILSGLSPDAAAREAADFPPPPALLEELFNLAPSPKREEQAAPEKFPKKPSWQKFRRERIALPPSNSYAGVQRVYDWYEPPPEDDGSDGVSAAQNPDPDGFDGWYEPPEGNADQSDIPDDWFEPPEKPDANEPLRVNDWYHPPERADVTRIVGNSRRDGDNPPAWDGTAENRKKSSRLGENGTAADSVGSLDEEEILRQMFAGSEENDREELSRPGDSTVVFDLDSDQLDALTQSPPNKAAVSSPGGRSKKTSDPQVPEAAADLPGHGDDGIAIDGEGMPDAKEANDLPAINRDDSDSISGGEGEAAGVVRLTGNPDTVQLPHGAESGLEERTGEKADQTPAEDGTLEAPEGIDTPFMSNLGNTFESSVFGEPSGMPDPFPNADDAEAASLSGDALADPSASGPESFLAAGGFSDVEPDPGPSGDTEELDLSLLIPKDKTEEGGGGVNTVLDPASVFANMDSFDLGDGGLDDEMRALLDDDAMAEEASGANDSPSGSSSKDMSVHDTEPPGLTKFGKLRWRTKHRIGNFARKVDMMVAWRDNWWLYCDLIAVLIATASLAVIVAYFKWHR